MLFRSYPGSDEYDVVVLEIVNGIKFEGNHLSSGGFHDNLLVIGNTTSTVLPQSSINNNTFNRADQSGLVIRNLTNISVHDNVFDTIAEEADSTYDVISCLSNCNLNSFQSNTQFGNGNTGGMARDFIRLQNANNNTVTDNRPRGIDGYAVNILSGGTNTVTGNTCISAGTSTCDGHVLSVPSTDTVIGKDGTGILIKSAGGATSIPNLIRPVCAIIENLTGTDDNKEFFIPFAATTLTSVGCRCNGTCSTLATFTLRDRAGNPVTITGTNPTCATSGDSTFAAITGVNTFVPGEGLAFSVSNTPTTGDTYTLCVTYLTD